MKKPFLRLMSLVLVITMMLTFTSTSFAGTAPKEDYKKIQDELLKKEKKQDEAIKTLKDYLKLSEAGNIVLDAPEDVTKKIDKDIYLTLTTGIEQTNKMIDSGYLKSDGNFNITVTEKYLETNNQIAAENNTVYLVDSSSEIQATATYNQQKVEWYWWGFKLYLNSTTANKVVAGIGIGTALATLIPDPTISKAVAAALAVAGSLVAYANAAGRGVIIRFNYYPLPPVIITGIYSQ